MAGHSHWAGIKHKKAANDIKRGKVFSRLAKLIYSAVKEGGGGKPEDNPRLRLILEKCRQANMPKDNIKRAIDKALDAGGAGYQPLTFEGYGPGGVAVIIECLTDNSNRTGPEVRNIFEKGGGKLGKPGCVAHQFQRLGVFEVDKSKADEERLLEIALEAGAEDIVDQGEFFEVLTDPNAFVTVGEALVRAGIETSKSELQLIPMNRIEVGVDVARKILKLTDKIEDQEEVQNVYTNLEVSATVAAELAAEAN